MNDFPSSRHYDPHATRPYPVHRVLRIGEFRIEPDLLSIHGPEGVTRVEAKTMDLLLLLARWRGTPVSKQEILEEVWKGQHVTDDVVWRAVGILRRALADSATSPAYIETIPRKGYRLLPLTSSKEPPAKRPLPKLHRSPGWRMLLLLLLMLAYLSIALVSMLYTRGDREMPATPALPIPSTLEP